MKRCLVDVNVLLALLVARHQQHDTALAWFDGLAPGEAALCRFVQLGLIRLLGNRTVMGDDAIPAAAAWEQIQTLLEDERIDFIQEPSRIDAILPRLFRYHVPTSKLIADAYLAALAMASSLRMVTLDRGMSQYQGLEVELLPV